MIDLIIVGASVIDGRATPRYTADLAIAGDRIAAIGALDDVPALERIDAAGLVLAPGFIDAHSHDDRALLGGAEAMLCKLSQGVTTVVTGNCGISLAPVAFDSRPPAPLDLLGDEQWWRFDSFASYARELVATPPALNALPLIGHMPIRIEAMDGATGRAATAAEIAWMRERLDRALCEGAAGLSTGLWYAPSSHAMVEEIVSLAQCAARRGGVYVTHLRDEGDRVEQAIDEAIDTSRTAGAPLVISHHKCTGPENFGKSQRTLAMIEESARDHPTALDTYPYSASSTALRPEVVRSEIETLVSWSVPHPDQAGRRLSAIAADWGLSLTEAARRLMPAGAIYFSMDESDVRRILAHRLTMVGSDGLPHDDRAHPRLWGAFPRVLGHYCREVGLFDLETAVHKMTGLTAATFGLPGRGIIEPAAYADLVLFDPERVIDCADFANPNRLSDGIIATWVNGTLAYEESKGATGACSGRLLSRSPAPRAQPSA